MTARLVCSIGVGLGLLVAMVAYVGPAEAVTTVPAYVTMISEPGDPVAQDGGAQLWRSGPQDVSFTGAMDDGSIAVDVSDGGQDSMRLEFDGTTSYGLGLREYPNAQTSPSADFGALRITRGGRDMCPKTRGWFAVRQFTRDTSRVWILYELTCLTTGTTVFGEVRRGATSDAPVVGMPAAIRWPSAEEGATTPQVPVTFLNTGAEPVEVTTTDVTGAPFFSVGANHCGTLAPNATCSILLSYTPPDPHRMSGVYGRLTIRSGDQALAWVELQGGSHRPGVTGLDITSQNGDWVGQGSSFSFRPQDGGFTVTGDESHVDLTLYLDRQVWNAVFDAGSDALVAGQTYRLVKFPSPWQPTLQVFGDGRGCAGTTGEFTVEQAEFDAQGVVAFAATFRQHCEGEPATLTGSAALAATQMPVVPEPLPVGPVAGLASSTDLYSVLVYWANPDVDTWTDTVVRMRKGDRAPGDATHGSLIYQGRGSAVLVRRLEPTTDYSFGVFTRDPEGLPGPPQMITVHGSGLSLNGPEQPLSAGETARLTGRLRSASGEPLAHRNIAIFWRENRDGSWRPTAGARTNARGRYDIPNQIATRTTQYRAVFWGSNRRFGDTAGPVTVRVLK